MGQHSEWCSGSRPSNIRSRFGIRLEFSPHNENRLIINILYQSDYQICRVIQSEVYKDS
jgi:hypothetical protein